MIIYILLFLIILIFLISYKYASGEDISPIIFEPHYSRLLTEKSEKYTSRPYWTKLSLKCGQRKLFFNELEFYTYIYKQDKNPIIVYAGAASGIHSVLFGELFGSSSDKSEKEGFDFYFYDPNPFYEGLLKYKNIHLFQEYFTDKIASNLFKTHFEKGRNIYFLSDIRSGTEEKYVEADMQMQMRWCEIIKPKMAMLKFRLPWTAGTTKYYAGKLYTQPRVGPVSTEMRLWTDCKKIINYDHDEYNNRCFYFNKYIRDAWHSFSLFETCFAFPKQVLEKNGIDHCYDCWSEIYILKEAIKAGIIKTTMEKALEDIATHTYSILTMPPHNLIYSFSLSEINFGKKSGLPFPKQVSSSKSLLLEEREEKINKTLWKKIIAMKDILTEYRHKKAQVKAEKFRKNKNRKMNTFQIVIYDYYDKLLKPPKFKYLNSTTLPFSWCKETAQPYYNNILEATAPTAEYRHINTWEKISMQAGQRSKILSITEFLCKNAQAGDTVILFTIKIGSYLIKLCKMFKDILFRIYFSGPLPDFFKQETVPNIIILNKLFTYEEAKKEKTGALFIFDVHFVSNSLPQIEVNNKSYVIQKKLCEILRPRQALLIYYIMSNKCEFYTGDLYIPPWKRQLSGILRLSTDCKETKKYLCSHIDKQMFYFDTCARNQWYKWPESFSSSSSSESKLSEEKTSFSLQNKFCKGNGIDHCYDCWREINIWIEYFKYINYPITTSHIIHRMLHPTNALHSSIQLPPHGMLPNEKDYKKRIVMLTNYTLYRQAIFKSIGKKLDEVKLNPTINIKIYIEDFY